MPSLKGYEFSGLEHDLVSLGRCKLNLAQASAFNHRTWGERKKEGGRLFLRYSLCINFNETIASSKQVDDWIKLY